MATTNQKTKKAAPPPPPHHLQFALVAPNFAPVSEPRDYKLSWTNIGDKKVQEISGKTDAQGLTELITTVGQVPVTLQIAPPEASDCKVVGSTKSKPLANKPLVRVQLQALASATSAPKPTNTCERMVVREGVQQIRFEMHNVQRYTSKTSGSSYPNYLKQLPYLIVDATKMEVIGNTIVPNNTARKMQGDNGRVATETVNVDGVEEVGLVLGSATDSPDIWQANKGELVLYKVKPKESGLTTVVISEVPDIGKFDNGVQKARDFKGTLNGETWAKLCRSFTVDDVKRILPGTLEITVPWPTPMHIDYALGRGVIDEAKAAAYREAYETRQAAIKAGTKLESKPTLAPLGYTCTWVELLTPIYEGRIENAKPANPDVPVIDPKTKKPQVDPKTKQPVTRKKFDKPGEYDALVQQGDGQILIPPLGLTLELCGSITGLGEPMAQNAQEVTGLTKGKVIAKTHPYAYLALLECSMNCGVTYVQINCTWRPMIGSVLHKLGDAIDIGRIDNGTDNLRIFKFLNSQVDDLADRFTKALNSHRYAVPGLTIYNLDNLPANAPFHDNHLHFTANRLKPLAEEDKPRPPMADSGSKP